MRTHANCKHFRKSDNPPSRDESYGHFVIHGNCLAPIPEIVLDKTVEPDVDGIQGTDCPCWEDIEGASSKKVINMKPGIKYHVQFTVGPRAESYSGFFVRKEQDGIVSVFENRTSDYIEETKIATASIVSSVNYGEKAPWLK